MDWSRFKVTATRLGSTARVMLAQLRGVGVEGDDEDAEPYDDAEVRQPLGLFSRPVITASLQALAVRLGHQILPLFLIDKSRAPFTDVEEGETRLYGAGNAAARVRHHADGSTDVESDTANGKDVVLNGGSAVVAAEGDFTLDGVLTGTIPGSPPIPVTFSFQPYDADGHPSGPPSVGTSVTVGGVILRGISRKVKA
jgi:hypothetical protein